MKRPKMDSWVYCARQRSVQILMALGFLYLLMVTLEIPFVFTSRSSSLSRDAVLRHCNRHRRRREPVMLSTEAPARPLNWVSLPPSLARPVKYKILSTLVFDAQTFEAIGEDGFSELHRSAKVAWKMGRKLWEDLKSGSIGSVRRAPENRSESCPHSIALTGSEFLSRRRSMVVPCGLTLGSHITVVAKPRDAHPDYEPKIAMLKKGEEFVMISQFVIELQGLRVVEGEEPPRIFHFNPRLMGDWRRKPVIEQNTCYRMQWGSPLRCEGWKSNADEETVDGHVKCEKWILDDDSHSEESKITWWLGRLIGRKKKVTIDWPYPFSEGKLFVLTLSAGLEGYHVNVDGRHVTSFPYRTGFGLEDATGLKVSGDIEVHSVLAASLPTSHPNFSPQKQLEMSSKWQAPPLPDEPVDVFIGILSAGGHFAERMAVRKSWMQHKLIKSSDVVARFFVAMNAKREVNAELKKEAEYFGDIVMVPYLDKYDLVVLKTVAICEYGVRTVSAKYIMKCDDDTFVRLGPSIAQAKAVPNSKSLYVGNINYYHRPLRYGKWAVTYEEWPAEAYPPYANGPGYILSSDIAKFIVTEFERHRLRLFKMEDVSVGMWVEQFNATKPVEYRHNYRFCQFGCIEGYYTAHYQSPRQMICLWDKLKKKEKPQCCNMR